MQRVPRGNIDLAPEGLAQLDPKARQIEEAAPTLEFDKEVNVTACPVITARDGAEHPGVHDAVLPHGRLDLVPEGFERGTHDDKSTPEAGQV